ncbi:MAG: hypothetical protein ABI878_00820 [Acidobacteriota bacterium]
MPAASFYVLALAVAMAVFFAIWWIFREDGDESAIILGGCSASVVLGGAVLVRELVFRRARNRILINQERLDRNLKGVSLNASINSARKDKLTLELNAVILREIKQKSEAARVLGVLASGHQEVFELCDRYLAVSSRELAIVGPGSPRLAALLKGKERAEEFHRFHMLRWAEIEAKALSGEAQSAVKMPARIQAAQRALTVVTIAAEHYPDDPNLTASGDAIREFLSSLKLSDRIEKAEKATSRRNYKQARKHYSEALRSLEKEIISENERTFAVARISDAVRRIEQLEG